MSKNDEKVTGVKTNGAITRETMASGRNSNVVRKRHGKGRHVVNDRPRVSSPAGIKVRAARRVASAAPSGPREQRFDRGYNVPGSLNPRKVGR